MEKTLTMHSCLATPRKALFNKTSDSFVTEMTKDEPTKRELRIELMVKSSNCCCICQTPYIHAHHIDFNNKNNVLDNLAPLCPNHHSLAHAKSNMFLNLTPERIRGIRDQWYEYCEKRKQSLGRNLGIAKLKVKNFDRSLGMYGASYGWAKTFASLDQNYRNLTKDEIIDRVFSTSNPDDLKTFLETMKNMYAKALKNKAVQERFREVCNAFGFDYDGENII